MSQYSILFVDDEKEIYQNIENKLEWESMGFSVAGYAENGMEALELAERLHPDVLLVDVEMPDMDGLSLCAKLIRSTQRKIRTIFLSESEKMEYLREAIRLGSEAYIQKPVCLGELQEALVKIKNSLDKEREVERTLDKLNRYHRKSLPQMKEYFIMSLLKGRIREEQIEEMNAEYEVYLYAPYYAVAVLKMDGEGKEHWESSRKEILASSLKQIIDENIPKEFRTYSMVSDDSVVVILMLESKGYFNRAVREMDQICRLAEKILEVNVTAGIGWVADTLGGLPESWKAALEAVEYRMFLGANRAYCISEVQPGANEEFSMDEQIAAQLLKDIKLGKEEELASDIDVLVEHLRGKKISVYKYQFIVIEIIMELVKLARTYRVKPEIIFGERFDVLQRIREFISLEEMGQWLKGLCLTLRASVRRERKDSAKLLVESAKQFIHENYMDSTLSVEVLCTHLNVSAAYFSTIFKRETGKSFVTYLTGVRMEAARELLNNTEDKTYVISAKVGYPEPNYFSYVFKKQFGIAPSRYRLEKAGQPENVDKTED